MRNPDALAVGDRPPSDSVPMIGRCVVVGVDGRPEARDAALMGRRLAEAAGGSLHFVSAASQVLIEVAAVRAGVPTERIDEALLDHARSVAAEGLRDDFDDDALAEILVSRLGRPEHVLAELGREVEADLYVLGGRRHWTATRWIHGGTAHHLLRVSDRPVLATGPSGSDVSRVIAGVDVSFALEPTIAVARGLAAALDVPVHALHVIGEALVPPEPGVDLVLDPWSDEEVERVVGSIEARLPDDVTLDVARGEVVPTIQEVVDADPATLLVVGAQGRGWVHRLLLGSTTEALLSELPCAVAVVPSHPEGSETR